MKQLNSIFTVALLFSANVHADDATVLERLAALEQKNNELEARVKRVEHGVAVPFGPLAGALRLALVQAAPVLNEARTRMNPEQRELLEVFVGWAEEFVACHATGSELPPTPQLGQDAAQLLTILQAAQFTVAMRHVLDGMPRLGDLPTGPSTDSQEAAQKAESDVQAAETTGPADSVINVTINPPSW